MQISKGFQKQQWSTELGTSTLNLMTSGGVPIRSTELGTCAEWWIQHENQSIETGE
jgi:hypothetical protein